MYKNIVAATAAAAVTPACGPIDFAVAVESIKYIKMPLLLLLLLVMLLLLLFLLVVL